jgi:hypothetical protein
MSIKKEIEKLLNDYQAWLKNRTILQEVNDSWIQITTPHLDRHNDCLQIYVKKEGNKYILSDDGYIINDLIMSGCSLETQKRDKLLHTVLAGFGITLSDRELTTNATSSNFPVKKHNLIQAMLAVNDIFYLSNPHAKTIFSEEVVKWFDQSGIRYTPNVKFAGKSGYDHHFDFVIPKSKNSPERIVQTLNHPQKSNMEASIFKWIDTKETRAPSSKMFIMLNNQNSKPPQPVLDGFHQYDIDTILWTEHENAKNILIA